MRPAIVRQFDRECGPGYVTVSASVRRVPAVVLRAHKGETECHCCGASLVQWVEFFDHSLNEHAEDECVVASSLSIVQLIDGVLQDPVVCLVDESCADAWEAAAVELEKGRAA